MKVENEFPLGRDHAIWGWLGLVLHPLKCASTNQRNPIY